MCGRGACECEKARRGRERSNANASPPFVTLLHKPARPFGAVPELDATRVGAGGEGGEEGVHVVRDGRQPECAGSEEKKKSGHSSSAHHFALSRGARAPPTHGTYSSSTRPDLERAREDTPSARTPGRVRVGTARRAVPLFAPALSLLLFQLSGPTNGRTGTWHAIMRWYDLPSTRTRRAEGRSGRQGAVYRHPDPLANATPPSLSHSSSSPPHQTHSAETTDRPGPRGEMLGMTVG